MEVVVPRAFRDGPHVIGESEFQAIERWRMAIGAGWYISSKTPIGNIGLVKLGRGGPGPRGE